MAKKIEITKIQAASRMSAKISDRKDAPWYSFECIIEKSLSGLTAEESQTEIDKAFELANNNVDKQLADAVEANKEDK